MRQKKKIFMKKETKNTKSNTQKNTVSKDGQFENTGKTEQEIAEWKKRFELIAEASGQVVYDYCLCDGSIEWSGSIEKVLGYKLSEMNGGIKQWEKLIHKEDKKEAIRLLEIAEKNLSPYEVEYRYKHKDGRYVNFLDKGFFISFPEKNCTRMIGMMQDITEWKTTEDRLKESNRKINTIVNNLPGVIYRCLNDSNWTMEYITNGIFELTGFPAEDFIDNKVRTFNSIIEPDDSNSVWVEIQKEIKRKKPFSLEYRIKCADGRIKWVLEKGIGIIENDNIIALEGYLMDITDSKKAELENALLAQSLKSVKDAISITDMNNKIMYVNNSFLKTYGYTEDEILGKETSVLRPELYAELTDKIHKETIEGGWYSELINIRKDGTEFPIELWTSSVKDDKKNIIASIGVARDITERKKAEDSLKQSENRLRTLFEAMDDVILVVDIEGKYIEIAPTNPSLLFKPAQELIGKKVHEVFPKEKADFFLESIQKCLYKNQSIYFEYNLPIDNKEFWFTASLTPLTKNSAILVARDITESVLAKRALQESEEKMQSIFRVAPAGIGLVKDRILMDINLHVCEMTGYTKEELFGKSSRVLYPTQEDFEFVGTEKYRQIKEIGTGLVETRWLKKDGKIINIILSSTPIDHNDISKGVIFTALDITERKEAEEKLRKSEERFKQVAESAEEWIWEVNTDGLYSYSSPVVEQILGYTYEEVVNKKYFYDFLIPDEKEEIKKAAFEIFKKKEQIKGLVNKNVHKNGNEVILETNGVPVLDDKNNLLGYRGVDKDITERKHAEEELIKAKEKAEEMNRVKTSFLANMSHEVRTPLVAILGFSEVLGEIVKDDELKNYVDMIHKGGERLLDTLNLILDLSVIEAQKIKIELSPLNIVKEIKEVVALFEKNAERKNINIKTICRFDSIIINLDEKIFRQIMNNLINNAIKYTASGGIKIKIDEEKKNSRNYVVIRVEDTGIGIPKDKQSIIWEEFRQVSEGFNRSFEGTGLGLSITKKFVDKLGGEIFLEKSEINVGSVFTVLFPIENKVKTISTQSQSETKIVKIAKPIKKELPVILYVEDDTISIDIVKAFIQGYCNIDSAFSGREGIEKAGNKLYDAILMDINLGKDMDGLEATELIRKLPEYKNIPIIAVTAFAMVGDKDEFFKKGCSHYLSKPFTKTEIRQLLVEVLQIKK